VTAPQADPLLALLKFRHGLTEQVRAEGERALHRIAALRARVQMLRHMRLRAHDALRADVSLAVHLISVADRHPLDGVPAPEYVPDSWDGPHVGKRLIEAFTTLRRLPLNWLPRQYGNSMPQYAYEWSDWMAQEQAEAEQKERTAAARNRVRVLLR
jgi:hypothetical protein